MSSTPFLGKLSVGIPAINADHDDTWEVEADAGADHSVCGGQVQSTGRVLCVSRGDD